MKFKTEAVLGLNYKTRAGHEPNNTPGVRTSVVLSPPPKQPLKSFHEKIHSKAGCQEQIFISSTTKVRLSYWKTKRKMKGGRCYQKQPWWSWQAQALQGAWNGMGTTEYQQWQPEMLLCFYVTHVLQFFSLNTVLKCAKSGTKTQLPEGELGEGRDFWFGSHWSLNQGGPGLTCDDIRFLFFSSLTDTPMLIKF